MFKGFHKGGVVKNPMKAGGLLTSEVPFIARNPTIQRMDAEENMLREALEMKRPAAIVTLVVQRLSEEDPKVLEDLGNRISRAAWENARRTRR